MDIEIWVGGLQEQEIEAIKKIGSAFSDAQPDGNPIQVTSTCNGMTI